MKKEQIMANNINRFLSKNNLSRKEFCERIGFKYSTMCEWMRGKSYPPMEKIIKMADFFKCEKSELIEETTSQNQDTNCNNHELLKRLLKDKYEIFTKGKLTFNGIEYEDMLYPVTEEDLLLYEKLFEKILEKGVKKGATRVEIHKKE